MSADPDPVLPHLPDGPEAESHATRERILLAAAECFAKSGLKHARSVSVLERGVAAGELAAGLDIEAAANDLVAVYLGLLRNHVSARPLAEVRSQRELEALNGLLLGGLLRRGAPEAVGGSSP